MSPTEVWFFGRGVEWALWPGTLNKLGVLCRLRVRRVREAG